jgi:broad specificity phosphatase PhoE
MRVPIRSPEIRDDPAAPAPERAPSLGTHARVWLVRHADVHDDWQQKAYGNLDVPLSDRGIRETHALVDAFATIPLALVASSPLQRALLLGQGLASGAHAPLRIDERLREVWRGDWQGLSVDEFRARWHAQAAAFAADPWNWKGHGGESDADIWARAWAALAETVRTAASARGPGSAVALATHFNVIRVLVTRMTGLRASQSFAFRNDTARVSLLVDGAAGWTLARSNVPASELATVEA